MSLAAVDTGQRTQVARAQVAAGILLGDVGERPARTAFGDLQPPDAHAQLAEQATHDGSIPGRPPGPPKRTDQMRACRVELAGVVERPPPELLEAGFLLA